MGVWARWRGVAFVVYALVLFTATHKPGVDVNVVPGWRIDLLVHVGAFGLWALLLGLSGLAGRVDTAAGLGRLVAIGLAYAAFDEGTQAIPGLRRVFAVEDLVANWAGIVCGSLCAFGVGRVGRRGGGPTGEG